MDNKTKNESLTLALSEAALRELPQVYDGENVYVRAIALVRKADGSENYALVRKSKEGKDIVCQDFGHMSVIRQIVEVYPYEFLQERFMPMFDKDDDRESRIAYLMSNDTLVKDASEYEKMSLAELEERLIGVAANAQIRNEKIRQRQEQIDKEAAQRRAEEEYRMRIANEALKEGVVTETESDTASDDGDESIQDVQEDITLDDEKPKRKVGRKPRNKQ